jgi:phage baseplate assembly protein W
MSTTLAPRSDLRVPLAVTSSGDLSLVTGTDALRQRLRHLILTAPGELLHRPRWGAGLPDEQNEVADAAYLARIRGRIREALERDPAVEAVTKLDATVDDAGLVEVTVWVRAAGQTFTYDGLRISTGATGA